MEPLASTSSENLKYLEFSIKKTEELLSIKMESLFTLGYSFVLNMSDILIILSRLADFFQKQEVRDRLLADFLKRRSGPAALDMQIIGFAMHFYLSSELNIIQNNLDYKFHILFTKSLIILLKGLNKFLLENSKSIVNNSEIPILLRTYTNVFSLLLKCLAGSPVQDLSKKAEILCAADAETSEICEFLCTKILNIGSKKIFKTPHPVGQCNLLEYYFLRLQSNMQKIVLLYNEMDVMQTFFQKCDDFYLLILKKFLKEILAKGKFEVGDMAYFPTKTLNILKKSIERCPNFEELFILHCEKSNFLFVEIHFLTVTSFFQRKIDSKFFTAHFHNNPRTESTKPTEMPLFDVEISDDKALADMLLKLFLSTSSIMAQTTTKLLLINRNADPTRNQNMARLFVRFLKRSFKIVHTKILTPNIIIIFLLTKGKYPNKDLYIKVFGKMPELIKILEPVLLLELNDSGSLTHGLIKLLKHFFLASTFFSDALDSEDSFKKEISYFFRKIQKHLKANPKTYIWGIILLIMLFNSLQEQEGLLMNKFFIPRNSMINEILESLTEKPLSIEWSEEQIKLFIKELVKFLNGTYDICKKIDNIERIFLEIWDYIFQEEKIIEALLDSNDFLNKIFLDSSLGKNFIIFELYMEYSYRLVTCKFLNPPFFRQKLFNYITDVFYCSVSSLTTDIDLIMKSESLYDEEVRIKNNQMQVLLRFYQDLVLGGERPFALSNFSYDKQDLDKLDDNRHIHFSEERCLDFQVYFLMTDHFEKTLLLIESNAFLQNKRMLFELLRLLLLFLLDNDKTIIDYFDERKFIERVYNIVRIVYRKWKFSTHELLYCLNMLINMGTRSLFFSNIENMIFIDSLTNCYDLKKPLSQIQSELMNIEGLAKYIQIMIASFFENVIQFIYEMKMKSDMKTIYITFIWKMCLDNSYNCKILSQAQFIEKMFIFLRLEKDFTLKQILGETCVAILRGNIYIPQFMGVIKTMRYDYYFEFIKSLFSNFDEDYTRDFFDEENFFISLKLLFQILSKSARSSELMQDSLFFSGRSSSILIRNFESFPSSAFTLTTCIKFNNLVTDEKQRFQKKFFESHPKSDPLLQNHLEYITKLDPDFEIRLDHFRYHLPHMQSSGSLVANRSRLTSFLHNKRENKYFFNPKKSGKYRPTLFCLKGKDKGLLEVYVDTENSNILVISYSVSNPETDTYEQYIRECFNYRFVEEEFYTITIKWRREKSTYFNVYVNGRKQKRIYNSKFKDFSADFKDLSHFSIGSTCPEKQEGLKGAKNDGKGQNKIIRNSFEGEMKDFYLFDKCLRKSDVVLLHESISSANYSELRSREDLEKSIVMNWDAFAWIKDELKTLDSKNWYILNKTNLLESYITFQQGEDKEKKNPQPLLIKYKQTLIDKFPSLIKNFPSQIDQKPEPDSSQNKKFEMRVRDVIFLTKNRLIDVFLSVGNMEIWLYIFDLLAQFNILSQQKSCLVLSEVFSLISILNREEKVVQRGEVTHFWRNNGLKLLSVLTAQFIEAKCCNENLIISLAEFVFSLNSDQVYQGFAGLFMNCDIWTSVNPEIFQLIFKKIYEFLQDASIFSKFKEHNKVEYLFYALSNYFSISKLSEEDNRRLLDKNLIMMKREILGLIKMVITKYHSEKILIFEINLFLNNLSISMNDENLIDFLMLLDEILDGGIANHRKKILENTEILQILLAIFKAFSERRICLIVKFFQEDPQDTIISLIISILSKLYFQESNQSGNIFFVPKSDSPSVSARSSINSKTGGRTNSDHSTQSKEKLSQATSVDIPNGKKNLSFVLPIIDKYMPIKIGKKTYKNLIKFINTSVQNKDYFDEMLFAIQYKRITYVEKDLRAEMMNDFVSLCQMSERFLNKILDYPLLPVFIYRLQDHLYAEDNGEDASKETLHNYLLELFSLYIARDDSGFRKIESLITNGEFKHFHYYLGVLFKVVSNITQNSTQTLKDMKPNQISTFILNMYNFLLFLEETIMDCPENLLIGNIENLLKILRILQKSFEDMNILYVTLPRIAKIDQKSAVDSMKLSENLKFFSKINILKNGGIFRAFISSYTKILKLQIPLEEIQITVIADLKNLVSLSPKNFQNLSDFQSNTFLKRFVNMPSLLDVYSLNDSKTAASENINYIEVVIKNLLDFILSHPKSIITRPIREAINLIGKLLPDIGTNYNEELNLSIQGKKRASVEEKFLVQSHKQIIVKDDEEFSPLFQSAYSFVPQIQQNIKKSEEREGKSEIPSDYNENLQSFLKFRKIFDEIYKTKIEEKWTHLFTLIKDSELGRGFYRFLKSGNSSKLEEIDRLSMMLLSYKKKFIFKKHCNIKNLNTDFNSYDSQEYLVKNYENLLEIRRNTYEKRIKEYKSNDLKNFIQLSKKWKHLTTTLTSERGVWRAIPSKTQKKIYKINKFQDSIYRRMNLKVSKNNEGREYLSLSMHKEKLRKQRELLSSPMPSSEMLTTFFAFSRNQDFYTPTILSSVPSLEGQTFSPKLAKQNSLLIKKLQEDQSFTSAVKTSESFINMKLTQVGKADQLENIVDEQFTEEDRKTTLTVYAEYIKLKGAFFGELTITEKDISFNTLEKTRPSDPEFVLGALSLNKFVPKKKQWNLKSIKYVFPRKFYLQSIALEIFTKNRKSYFFNVYTHSRQQEALSCLKQRVKKNNIIFDAKKEFKKEDFTSRWLRREISNFEYLMILNIYAGRSLNDLNQYPVFPWILEKYDIPELNLEDKNIYRDLSKPIGMLNPKRASVYLKRFEEWEDPKIPKFHYGSHYSTAANVMNYLIRLEPFSSMVLDLHGGKFDIPDRIFNNISSLWNLCYVQTSDVKELIPEFFYLPEFLKNRNKYEFGKTQTNVDVEDVILPAWALSPEDFIDKHRQALESDFVSERINNWIDLIFGYKQTGKKAIEAANIFYYLTYEGQFNLEELNNDFEKTAVLSQIANFGQTPSQLFSDAHPRRTPLTIKRPILELTKTFYQISKLHDFRIPILYSSINIKGCIYIVLKNSKLYIASLKSSIIGKESRGFEIKKIVPLGKVLYNELSDTNSIFSVFTDRQNVPVLLAGGFSDCSLRYVREGKPPQKVPKIHHRAISTMAFCSSSKRLVCGSKDYRLSVWKINKEKNTFVHKSRCFLYGHHNEITSVVVNSVLQLIFSLDKNSVVIMHSIPDGRFINIIQPCLGKNETIVGMLVNDNGLIILRSNRNSIFVYNLSAQILNTVILDFKNGASVTSLQFFFEKQSELIGTNSKGEIFLLNIFSLALHSIIKFSELIHREGPIDSSSNSVDESADCSISVVCCDKDLNSISISTQGGKLYSFTIK